VIPIRDTQRARRFPFVTVLLLLMNAGVWAHELTLGPALEAFTREWGLVPARLLGGGSAPERLAPLVTSMFLHGGWLHVIGNMLYLWVFGDNVEDRLGHGRFLVFYGLCGVAAGLGQVASSPGSELPMVGASGAVAGVLGAYFLQYPTARVLTIIPILFYPLFVHVPAVVFLGVWFVMQLTSAWSGAGEAASVQEAGIAWWAHASGFVAGGVLLLALRPPERRRRRLLPW
jgi:membrane associated rhomboid family serine protease